MNRRRILVTSALPYINGPIHLGHIIEAIQTDIWVRLQRRLGHECWYVSAVDTHGTATMLRAEAEGRTTDELIASTSTEHEADFRDFGISLDYFYSTDSAENKELVELIYGELQRGGHITRRPVRQFFDPKREMFLPDRFVKGTCPRCKSPDQNGDSCDVCGSTYSPADLIDPRSTLTGEKPIEKESEHLFLELSHFEPMLRQWVESGSIQTEVRNKLNEWFSEGLKAWDISREAPYFGFEIPDAPGKYFYVWVDAPIGYLASFRKLCEREGLRFEDFWAPGNEQGPNATEVHHFIGKDILYFHCLFWPAMLHGGGLRLPTSVPVHGFLTVDGTKMSKSKGTFIRAREYLDHLPADALRYYFAAKLGSGLGDIDLNLEDFVARFNSDLVGKIVNIASRCSGILHRKFDGRLGSVLDQPELFERIADARSEVAALLEAREFNRAVRLIMASADEANRYIDDRKPWQLAKQDGSEAELHGVLTTAINLFRVLIGLLAPIIPETARRAESFLAAPVAHWDDIAQPLLDHKIEPYEALLRRLEASQVEQLRSTPAAVGPAPTTATTKGSGTVATGAGAAKRAPNRGPDTKGQTTGATESSETTEKAEKLGLIAFDDFARLDLRVARVVSAEFVEGADRLLRLQVDLGEEGTSRTVFAGIRRAYDPADLTGRLVVIVANLQPKKMRFGVSQGMALAAENDSGLFLLSVDSGARPGDRVR